MKSLVLIFSFLFSFSSIETVNNSCDPYLPFEKGSKWEHTYYNAKGKVQSSVSSELLSIEENGPTTEYEVRSISKDKKGEEVYNQAFKASCTDGVFDVDMSSLFPTSLYEQYREMNITVDNSQLHYPDFNATEGTTLEDSEMTVSIDMPGLGAVNIIMLIKNRKVDIKESMTVPAGTFDCIVLTQDMEVTIMGIKSRSSSREWFAVGTGMVRSESYNKNGKLNGYTELTQLSY